MVRADVVTEKLQELAHRVERVRACCPPTADDLARDENAAELVAFNLMLAVQVCADIASHLIADEGLRTAVTLATAFRRLAEHGVITDETARAMARAASFRNIVAHGYARLDLAAAFRAATEGLGDLVAFGREVAAYVQRAPNG